MMLLFGRVYSTYVTTCKMIDHVFCAAVWIRAYMNYGAVRCSILCVTAIKNSVIVTAVFREMQCNVLIVTGIDGLFHLCDTVHCYWSAESM